MTKHMRAHPLGRDARVPAIARTIWNKRTRLKCDLPLGKSQSGPPRRQLQPFARPLPARVEIGTSRSFEPLPRTIRNGCPARIAPRGRLTSSLARSPNRKGARATRGCARQSIRHSLRGPRRLRTFARCRRIEDARQRPFEAAGGAEPMMDRRSEGHHRQETHRTVATPRSAVRQSRARARPIAYPGLESSSARGLTEWPESSLRLVRDHCDKRQAYGSKHPASAAIMSRKRSTSARSSGVTSGKGLGGDHRAVKSCPVRLETGDGVKQVRRRQLVEQRGLEARAGHDQHCAPLPPAGGCVDHLRPAGLRPRPNP